MSVLNIASIQETVRAMAAKESQDRRTVVDLLFQIGILPGSVIAEINKMHPHPFEMTLGGVFRGALDIQLSSALDRMFRTGLSHIADKLEASVQAKRYETEDSQVAKIGENSTLDPTDGKKTKVEKCFVLDVTHLEQWKILLQHAPRTGFLILFKTLTGAPLLCRWQMDRSEIFSTLRLDYRTPGSVRDASSSVEIWISKRSDKTQPLHYWMKCFHEIEGEGPCRHRQLLYLPPGHETFKCNQCYDLDHHRSRSMKGLDLSVPLFFLAKQEERPRR